MKQLQRYYFYVGIPVLAVVLGTMAAMVKLLRLDDEHQSHLVVPVLHSPCCGGKRRRLHWIWRVIPKAASSDELRLLLDPTGSLFASPSLLSCSASRGR